jgi:glyoxylase-like metal-dependent hydrolase (beta-lactamase superfamily II)
MAAIWMLLALEAASAQPAGVLESAAVRLGVTNIQSLQFEAQGRYYQFSQAPAPDLPWPPFDVRLYAATLDFARATVHAKYHRVQVQEPGRARPHSEATMDQYYADDVTWNGSPNAVAMPSNLAERQAELWASPQGFIKAAVAHHAVVKRTTDGATVSFSLGKMRYHGELGAEGDVRSVRTYIPSTVLGDTPVEFRYSEYRDFGGVRFPGRIERRAAGLPWYELTVNSVNVNTAMPITVPAEVAANPVPVVTRVEITEIAPGVFNFGGASHNSVVVEQADGIVVIEAPLDESRSLAVIAKVREKFPAKPIRQVVNTHAHFDHAGGLRTYVAEGVTVVTHERNAAYYRRAWQALRLLEPDRLSRQKRRPQFETFTERLVLADPERPIELHTILASGHNDAFAMAWLPKQGLLVEGDAWTPTAAGAKPPAVVNPLWLNLRDNIVRLGLEVRQVQPLHGVLQSREDFERALQPPAH